MSFASIQLTEYDLLVLLADICYVLLLINIIIKSSQFIANFNFLTIVKEIDYIGYSLIISTFLLSIILIIAVAVSREAQESFLSILNIFLYVAVGLLMFGSRKLFNFVNMSNNYITEQINTKNATICILESINMVATTIVVIAILKFFYEETLLFIILALFAAELFGGMLLKLQLLLLNKNCLDSRLGMLVNDNYPVILQIATLRFYTSLSLFAAASIMSFEGYSLSVSLMRWIYIALVIMILIYFIILIIDKLLFKGCGYLYKFSIEKNLSFSLIQFIIYTAVNLLIILLLT